MIFIKIENEAIVQVEDKTRINISKSYISGSVATIDKYEIKPTGAESFIDVTDDKYLDWSYQADTVETIEVRLTDSDLNEETKTASIEILSVADDNLFSKDQDIIPYEVDLLDYVQDGRDSFLDKHRAAQTEILNDLDEAGIWKRDNSRYTAADIVDIQEFKEWSKFVALRIIFKGLSNSLEDVYLEKATNYESMATSAKKRAALRLDSNGDGENSTAEMVNLTSGLMSRQI